MLLRITVFLLAVVSIHAKCRPTFESLHCVADIAAETPASVTTDEAPTASSAIAAAPQPEFRPQRPVFDTPKWMSPYRMAQLSMVGAAAADISSSWGCAEANPILRSSDGRFRAQGFAIKAGVTAGGLLATHLLRKKYPKLEKPLTFMMGSTSTFLYATAFRNHSMPCH